MKERLAKLIDVKSIVTLLLTVTFIVLAFLEIISGEQVNNVFMIVISFFFGVQTAKKNNTQ
jgi:uncharacterized membrane protein